jgi:hypothetical protein
MDCLPAQLKLKVCELQSQNQIQIASQINFDSDFFNSIFIVSFLLQLERESSSCFSRRVERGEPMEEEEPPLERAHSKSQVPNAVSTRSW